MAAQKKTIEHKKQTGNYRPGKDGTIGDPPQGKLGRPPAPKSLTKLELEVFNNVCDLLMEAEWLRVSDGPTVHAFSVLQNRLNIDPDSFTAADFTQFRLLANELGMSPAARAKMPHKPVEEKKSSFSDL